MSRNQIDYSISLSHSSVAETGVEQTIYALVEIAGGGDAGKIPSSICFVIDVSDSMQIRLVTEQQFAELVKQGHVQEVLSDGVPAYQISSIPQETAAQLPRRIDYVKRAIEYASEVLRNEDIFSLAAFSSQAKRLLASTSGRDRGELKTIAGSLDSLALGDGTRLDLGLKMAYEELKSTKMKEFAPRMIILTDGYTSSVESCYTWAKRAAQDGIKISTMGMGTEFNEDLLIPLADLTGGNAYYIERPAQIDGAFQKEIGSALGISYRNMELKIKPSRDLELRSVYRIQPALGNFEQSLVLDGSFSLLIGDYDPGVPVSLLIELRCPNKFLADRYSIKSLLAWDSPNGGIRKNLRQESQIRRTEDTDVQSVQRVMEIVSRVEAFRNGIQAIESARRAVESEDLEQKGAATIRLRQAATSLLDFGETALAGAMFHQADQLKMSGNLDSSAIKKIRYETRRLN